MSNGYLVPLDDPKVGAFRALPPTRTPRRVAKGLAVLLLVTAVGLAVVPWQQTAYGEGQVIARSPSDRQQRIDAPVEGWLEEWFVEEGSLVAEGDPVVRIADNDPQILARLDAEQQAIADRVKASEVALETARRNVERQRQLVSQGLASRKQFEDAQLKEADVLKEVTAARAEVARLGTRLARQNRQVVRAPKPGVILRRAAGAGSVYVKLGDPLAVLVPEARDNAVEVWLDGNDLPLLSQGRGARLQFEGWPAIQFSGWPWLAVGTFAAQVAVIDSAGASRPGMFRVLLVPTAGDIWPKRSILRQGVRAHAWVLLDTVPLGHELWRRFNNFPRTLPELKAEDYLEPAPGAAGMPAPKKGTPKDKAADGEKK